MSSAWAWSLGQPGLCRGRLAAHAVADRRRSPRPRPAADRQRRAACADRPGSDIAASLARGHSIRQTARALGISPKTVENTQTRLFRRLGVRNRAEALGALEALGLLPDTAGAVLA
jgi:DNA-binding CsgD family transcriptional regulator